LGTTWLRVVSPDFERFRTLRQPRVAQVAVAQVARVAGVEAAW